MDYTPMKERAGAYYFLATDLLNSRLKDVVHCVDHDLQSFFWLLLWVVLRHTEHEHSLGEDAWADIFTYGNDRQARLVKVGWLFSFPRITIKDDAPLTDILLRFIDKMRGATRTSYTPHLPLTYEILSEVFGAAPTARGDGPKENPPLGLPSTPRTIRISAPIKDESPRKQDNKRRFISFDEQEESLPGSGSATLDSGNGSGAGSGKRLRRSACESAPTLRGNDASGTRVTTRGATAELATDSRSSHDGEIALKTAGRHPKASEKGSKGSKPASGV